MYQTKTVETVLRKGLSQTFQLANGRNAWVVKLNINSAENSPAVEN